MKKNSQIVGYVEDPGAANFFVGLRSALSQKNVDFNLYASGAALTYLISRNEPVEDFTELKDLSHNILKGADLLVVGTSENKDSPAFDLVANTKKLGVQTIGLVDAPSSLSSRFKGHSENPLHHLTDRVVVAQHEARDGLINLGVDAQNIIAIRHPYYDYLSQRRVTFEQQDFTKKRLELFGPEAAHRKIVVFLSEISSGLVSRDFQKSSEYSLTGKPQSKKRTHVVLDEVIASLANFRDEIVFTCRLHPKDEINDYSGYSKDIDIFSGDGDPQELVFFADCVIGMTSNLLVEAALFGTHVLSVIPRESEYAWLPQATNPPIPVVWTRTGLQYEIANMLARDEMASSHKRIDMSWPTLAETLISEIQIPAFEADL